MQNDDFPKKKKYKKYECPIFCVTFEDENKLVYKKKKTMKPPIHKINI